MLCIFFLFLFVEIPGAPQNLAVNASGRGNVTITGSWMHPQNFNQFDIDRYDISVTSTSVIQNMTTTCGQCTNVIVNLSESDANSQQEATFNTTISATNQCGETGAIATVSTSKSSLALLCHSLVLISISG